MSYPHITISLRNCRMFYFLSKATMVCLGTITVLSRHFVWMVVKIDKDLYLAKSNLNPNSLHIGHRFEKEK